MVLLGAWAQFSPTPKKSSPPASLAGSPTPTPSVRSPSPNPSLAPIPTPSPSPIPTPPPSLYVGILDGDQYGNVRAQTEPGASCSLRVGLPNGSDAPGIHNPQTARADGVVEWIYRQLPTDEGIGIHSVTCSLNGLTGTAWVYMEVGS